jgi:hypothetical protein
MYIVVICFPSSFLCFSFEFSEPISVFLVVGFPNFPSSFVLFVDNFSYLSLVNKCKPLPGISDHDIVLVDTNIRIDRIKQTKRKIYLWKSTNMDELRTEVQTTVVHIRISVIEGCC